MMQKEPRALSFWHPATLLGTWFGAGLSPKAPGTMGSFAALPFAWAIVTYFGLQGLIIATILCFFIGWWACAVYCRETGKQDPKEMVIDEVAGMWLTLLCFLPVWQGMMIYSISDKMAGHAILAVVPFTLFRIFDIWKPWPVSLADQNIKGGLGVMLDDIIAALYTPIVVSLFLFVLATFIRLFES